MLADLARRSTVAPLFGGIAACAAMLLVGACGGDDAGAESGGGQGGAGQGSGSASGGCSLGAGTRSGEGTYYDADGSGNCSFPATPDDLLVAAMNDADYASSALCGACARVTGPQGTVTVRIVDRCPECPQGDVDMSPQAFSQIAPLEAGRVPITWELVACALDGPLVYHFKEGSNPFWTAVQIRNHRHPIARFEYRDPSGAYRDVPRESYNYFVEENGMGEGPFAFRVTDALGQTIEDSGIPLLDNAEAPGSSQLAPCAKP